MYHDTHKRRNIVPNTLFYGQNSDDSSSNTSGSGSIKSQGTDPERRSVNNYETENKNRTFSYNQNLSRPNGFLPNENDEPKKKSPQSSSAGRKSPQKSNQRKKISPVSVRKKPALIRTISVSDIGSIRVKRKGGNPTNEAAQDFLSRKQEDTPRHEAAQDFLSRKQEDAPRHEAAQDFLSRKQEDAPRHEAAQDFLSRKQEDAPRHEAAQDFLSRKQEDAPRHEAAQDFLSRKQEDAPRRKGLFGRGGSLFDLFGLNQNNHEDSSSSSSSADTVIESPSPEVQKKSMYRSKSSAQLDSGRISPLTVAPGRTLAEQIRIDKEREREEVRRRELEEQRKAELEKWKRDEAEKRKRDEEVLARQKYEQEVLAARSKARERLEREERARLLNPPPVVSQRSLLLVSKHLEDEKRKSKRFSKAEMATARSMLDRLNITKKTDMTETDTVKLKKQKSRGKVIQTTLLFTRALKKCFTTI